MEDTSPVAIVDRIVGRMSPGERLILCAELYDDAKEFARIGIPEGLTPEEERSFIFERLHGLPPSEIIKQDTL